MGRILPTGPHFEKRGDPTPHPWKSSPPAPRPPSSQNRKGRERRRRSFPSIPSRRLHSNSSSSPPASADIPIGRHVSVDSDAEARGRGLIDRSIGTRGSREFTCGKRGGGARKPLLVCDPAAGMGQDLVEIHPRELQFTFEVKKQSSCTVHLVNKSNEYVAFKVKTTSPKRYCVRPNTGVILPRKTCDFTVTMQALRTAPTDMQLKDKFLVQTTVVPYGTSEEDLIPAFFSKETGRYIEESKLRVVLVSASDPLEEQPVNGFHSTGPAIEVSALKEMSNIENKAPAIPKEVPHPIEQTPAVVTKIPSPVKETQGLRETPVPIEQTPGLREVPVPLNGSPAILTESPSPKKYASAITIDHAPAIMIDHAPAITIDHTPPITVDPLPPLIQNTAAFKESPPKEAIMLSDRGLFNVQNHQLSHVTEDVQNLKSKLDNLESKLEEAEKMIITLREESRNTTQERDKLQQEMVFLKKKGIPRNQVGFPLLFVVYVALLGTLLGYLLRL